ncbi:MAG: TetR/AcrR family transcriptional regulator [Spirochaetaceae bacterium]|nr:MAG: TetR/AcrR family transcriptional regulator [Spirochaetaceae bacterium]
MDAPTRKTELLDLAQRLFLQDGYDSTPISRIIEEAGIAKGTFYHHFKSKAELVEALVERQVQGLLPAYDAALERTDLSPVEQLQLFFDISIVWKANNVELMVATIQALYTDDNLVLRKRMNEQNVKAFSPYLNEVVRRGAEAGVFHTPYGNRLGSFLLSMMVGLAEAQGQMVAGLLEHPDNIDAYAEFMEMVEHSINRMLGLEDGTISIGARAILEPLRAYVIARSTQ